MIGRGDASAPRRGPQEFHPLPSRTFGSRPQKPPPNLSGSFDPPPTADQHGSNYPSRLGANGPLPCDHLRREPFEQVAGSWNAQHRTTRRGKTRTSEAQVGASQNEWARLRLMWRFGSSPNTSRTAPPSRMLQGVSCTRTRSRPILPRRRRRSPQLRGGRLHICLPYQPIHHVSGEILRVLLFLLLGLVDFHARRLPG